MLLKPDLRPLIAISLGAIAGALSRYYLGLWLNLVLGTAFPFSTFLINLSGCFGMGFLIALSLRQDGLIHPDVRLLMTTGFLGSYTTFATYELELASLLQDSPFLDELFYGMGSTMLGLLALQLGSFLGARLN